MKCPEARRRASGFLPPKKIPSSHKIPITHLTACNIELPETQFELRIKRSHHKALASFPSSWPTLFSFERDTANISELAAELAVDDKAGARMKKPSRSKCDSRNRCLSLRFNVFIRRSVSSFGRLSEKPSSEKRTMSPLDVLAHQQLPRYFFMPANFKRSW